MSRWLLVALVLAPTAACIATSRQPHTLPVGNAAAPATAAEDLPDSLDSEAQSDAAELEDWRSHLGDVVDDASLRLHAWVDEAHPVGHDLSMLTTAPVQGVRSSGYGWRSDPFRHTRRFHSGADFPSKSGTPVAAAGEGVVTFAGRASGYGNMILIDHGGGVATLYGHLRRIEVDRGFRIAAGDRIGQVGRTGRATGPHLHFEVRVDGHPVDPVTAMAGSDGEPASPDTRTLAAVAPPSNAGEKAADGTHHRVRRKTSSRLSRSHGKRPQTLW